MRKVLMTRKSTNAMPSERIQLSNQRASLERRFSGGAKGTGATRAPEPPRGAPKRCMALTLARLSAGRNSHGPPPCRSPLPHPQSELFRSVGVAHARGKTGGVALPLDAVPGDGRRVQRVERLSVERRATGAEH